MEDPNEKAKPVSGKATSDTQDESISTHNMNHKDTRARGEYPSSFEKAQIRKQSAFSALRENESKDNLASFERSITASIETLRRDMTQKIEDVQLEPQSQTIDSVVAAAEETVRKRIDEKLGDDILSVVGQKVAQQAKDHVQRADLRQSIEDTFNRSRDRIQLYANKASMASDAFRRLGYILAVTGLTVAILNLGVAFHTDALATTNEITWAKLLRHLPYSAPVIILSEFLALIMFRYYSRSLEQMRYFSNEVTTLDIRQTGVLLMVQQGSKSDLMKAATELARVERNIILRKDERTMELANNRDEDAMIKALTDKIDSLFKRDRGSRSNANGQAGTA